MHPVGCGVISADDKTTKAARKAAVMAGASLIIILSKYVQGINIYQGNWSEPEAVLSADMQAGKSYLAALQ